MTGSRVLPRRRGWAVRTVAGILGPLLRVAVRRRWLDGERIPPAGGCVIAANHVSHLDPLTFALFVYEQGRIPRFLAKAAVFKVPGIGSVLRSAGQIPVHRLTADADQALDAAIDAVREGEAVVVYPEGTITRAPGLWPMTGRTGAARIALTAGVPVIPVAQWGANHVLRPYERLPRLLPRKTVWARAGDPVDLDDLRGQPTTPDLLHEASERIMRDITALLAPIRDEEPPAGGLFDPREHGVAEVGNPNPRSRRWPGRARGRR